MHIVVQRTASNASLITPESRITLGIASCNDPRRATEEATLPPSHGRDRQSLSKPQINIMHTVLAPKSHQAITPQYQITGTNNLFYFVIILVIYLILISQNQLVWIFICRYWQKKRSGIRARLRFSLKERWWVPASRLHTITDSSCYNISNYSIDRRSHLSKNVNVFSICQDDICRHFIPEYNSFIQ